MEAVDSYKLYLNEMDFKTDNNLVKTFVYPKNQKVLLLNNPLRQLFIFILTQLTDWINQKLSLKCFW